MQNILHNKAYNIDNLFLNFRTFFADLIKEASIENKILVVPTAKYARHLRQIYIRKHFEIHDTPCSNLNIMNFDSFVKLLYQRLDREASKNIISDAYRFLLIENAIKNTSTDYFKQSSGSVKLSLAKQLDSLIIGLKRKGITSEKIQKELSSPELANTEIKNLKKYKEIHDIYSKYQESLGEDLLDEVDILKYIIKTIEGAESKEEDIFDTIDIPVKHDNPVDSVLSEINEILFYGFSDFTLPEQRLISLFTHSNRIQVAIYLENLKTDSNYNLPDVSVRFTSYGFINSAQSYLFEEDEINKLLKSSLFIKSRPDLKIPLDTLPFYLLSSENISEEIENISRFVSYLIRDKNISPSKIALVTREAGTFAKPIRDNFMRYQIPLNISDRFDLQNSTIVSTVLNIIDTVIYGYKLTNLEKVFASYYMQHLDIDFSLVRKYAYKLRIIGGHDRGSLPAWKRRIESYKTYLKAKLDDHTFFEDYLEEASYKKEYQEINKVYTEMTKIESIFPKVKSKMSTSDFIDLIHKILQNVKFEEKITEDNLSLQSAEMKSKYIKESIQDSIEKDGRALIAFTNLLNEISYLNKSNSKLYNAIEHIDKLKVLVSGTKYQIREKEQFGVTLTSIEQTRGLPYEYIIMCGAVEGKFPLPFKTNVMLGKNLPESNLHHIQEERNLLYALLTGNLSDAISKGRKVVLSYSNKDEENDFARSHFIDELISTLSIEDESVLQLQNHFDYKSHSVYFKHMSSDTYYHSRDVNLALTDDADHQSKFSRAFSPTNFERYTDCPFRYMIQRVFAIDEIDKEDLMLTPLEKGSLLHKILYRFYSNLSQDSTHQIQVAKYKNGNTLYGIKLDQMKKDYYLNSLMDIAKEEIQKFSYEHPLFEVETDKIFGSKSFTGILSLWLSNELKFAADNPSLYPVFFEYSFGDSEKSAFFISEDVKIKGKVDRVEISPNLKYYAIGDYKSNAQNQTKDKADEFTKFQMPLYSYAISKFLSNEIEEEFHHLYGIYYSLNPEGIWNNKALYSKEDYKEYYGSSPRGQFFESETQSDLQKRIEEYVATAIDIVHKIRSGQFNVTPNLKHSYCSSCDFQQSCRIRKFEFKL